MIAAINRKKQLCWFKLKFFHIWLYFSYINQLLFDLYFIRNRLKSLRTVIMLLLDIGSTFYFLPSPSHLRMRNFRLISRYHISDIFFLLNLFFFIVRRSLIFLGSRIGIYSYLLLNFFQL